MRNSFQSKMDWALLKSVSRSFYLTLRLLPHEVHFEITLAYLLARASDTIADTSHADVSTRVQVLKFLQTFAQGNQVQWDPRLGGALAQFQSHQGERQLLEYLPSLLEEFKNGSHIEEIREVWSTILDGQIFDLENSFSSPLDSEQLDRYTFQVAGCVGKFWTQLCFRKMPDFSSSSFAHMEELGICYGKGLQLINILRDRKEDALRGRTYLKEEDVEKYSEDAFSSMRAGIEYATAVKHPLLRYATILPALLGMHTLKLLSPGSVGVKIPRKKVYQILVTALPCLWSAQFAFSLTKRWNRKF